MAIQKIPINKGVFKLQSTESLLNSEFAEDLINQLIDEAGTNYDRPTLESFATLSSIHPIGAYPFKDLIVIVTLDRKIYTMDANAIITDITGVSLGGTARPTFANNGSTVFIVGGTTPIKWTPGGVTEAVGGTPPSMTHIVYLDGYLIGNRRLTSENNKVIQYSDIDNSESWTATNIFSANANPDEVQGLTISQRELYVVGQETIEVWQNIGTSPVPFGRAFVWDYGTPAPYSILSEDNSVFILTQDRQILRFLGRTPTRVSEGIEEAIKSYDTVNDCVAGSFKWDGSLHVMFLFPSASAAWSVDLKNGQWTEWRGWGEIDWSRVRINCVVYSQAHQAVYAGDFLTGNVWKFSRTEKTDAGGIFARQRTLAARDAGASVRKRADLFRMKLKRNIGQSFTGTSSQTNPTLELRWKDDDKPWSTFRRASLGEVGEQKNYAEFRRLGIYRSRKYQYRMTDPCELNVSGIDTDETVMSS